MIKSLRIINFKSHKDTELSLGNLTVLSGQNGVGKSSVIQSLLLLRQTHLKNRLDKILDLNSPLCFIGKSQDALYRYPHEKFENQLGFVISDETCEYSWFFGDKNSNNNYSFLDRVNNLSESGGYEKLSLFGNDFQYLSAYRNDLYLADDYAVLMQKQISVNEGKGELVAHFLNEYGKSLKVVPALCHPSEKDSFLLSQVSAWECEISANVNISPVRYGEGYDIRYGFSTGNSLGPVDDLSKKNVGFGLSYVLPILVAILASQPGALLLIENPEAHIHPAGISKLSELICLASQHGIQIILETHSDHIVNGILVQCKKFESDDTQGINRENLKMYYLERDETEHKTNVTEILIGKGGRTETRVDGFFDQIGKDLRKLI